VSDEVVGDLLAFLGASPTPYHAVDESRRRLEAAGFRRLDEADRWDRLPAGAYYVTSSGSNLIAFALPAPERRTRFCIVGAHTDSPNLRLKPNPEYTAEGYAQLGVEVYGGALLNSWLDRDLGLAGRVLVKRERGEIDERSESGGGGPCRLGRRGGGSPPLDRRA
jgi:aspartyl aminopeptidase